MKCSLCDTALLTERDEFGHPEHPVCLMCWLGGGEPGVLHPTTGDGFTWVKSSEEVDVPWKIAHCCYCSSTIYVEIGEWGVDDRIPAGDSCWISHCCEGTCRGNDAMGEETAARIRAWVEKNVRVLRDAPSIDKRIPGIRVPALEAGK